MAGAEQYGRAARAAAEILRKGFDVRVEKALNPLDDGDFVVLSEQIRRSLVTAARPHEQAVIDRVVQDLDVKWVELDESQKTAVLEKAKRRFFGLPAAVITGIVLALGSKIDEVAVEARRRSVDKFDLKIPRDLGVDDDRSLGFQLSSEGLHVDEEYQRRATSFETLTRAVVAAGLAAGLSNVAIAGQLAELVRAAQLARSDAYWGVSAMASANYARTAAQLNAFSEAGILTYLFVAVMDERTTEICRYMNGRRLSVRRAVEQLRTVETLETSAAIKMARPWVGRGKDEQGNDMLYFKQGERRVVVARIGANGAFTDGLTDEQLEAAGLLVPPLHGWCRSKIIVF